MRVSFIDRAGRAGHADGTPGSAFGLRLDAAEVTRLFAEHGDALPFDIMAAGYGEDADWVGLSSDDLDLEPDELPGILASWAPFEIFDDTFGAGLGEHIVVLDDTVDPPTYVVRRRSDEVVIAQGIDDRDAALALADERNRPERAAA